MTKYFEVGLDAGHGINTPGKRVPKELDANQTREWTLNNRICNYIEEDLLANYEKIRVHRLDDRTGKKDIPLPDRTALANKLKLDVVFSVHANAYLGEPWEGGGVVTFNHPQSSKASKELNALLASELVKETGLKGDRWKTNQTANFHMIRETKMPAVLSENGFMDSRVDWPIIKTEDFARKAAKAHINTLVKYYKLKKKTNAEVEKPKQPDTTLYRVQVGAYRDKKNAETMANKLNAEKYNTYLIQSDDGLYRVQTGAFAIKTNAVKLETELKKKGFATYITTNISTSAQINPLPMKEGSRVKVRKGAKTYTNGAIASFIYNNTYTIDYLNGDRAVLDAKGINTPFNTKDLELIN